MARGSRGVCAALALTAPAVRLAKSVYGDDELKTSDRQVVEQLTHECLRGADPVATIVASCGILSGGDGAGADPQAGWFQPTCSQAYAFNQPLSCVFLSVVGPG